VWNGHLALTIGPVAGLHAAMNGFRTALIIWPWPTALVGLMILQGEVTRSMQTAVWVLIGLAVIVSVGAMAYRYGKPPNLDHPD
jgi:hypothetical protein